MSLKISVFIVWWIILEVFQDQHLQLESLFFVWCTQKQSLFLSLHSSWSMQPDQWECQSCWFPQHSFFLLLLWYSDHNFHCLALQHQWIHLWSVMNKLSWSKFFCTFLETNCSTHSASLMMPCAWECHLFREVWWTLTLNSWWQHITPESYHLSWQKDHWWCVNMWLSLTLLKKRMCLIYTQGHNQFLILDIAKWVCSYMQHNHVKSLLIEVLCVFNQISITLSQPLWSNLQWIFQIWMQSINSSFFNLCLCHQSILECMIRKVEHLLDCSPWEVLWSLKPVEVPYVEKLENEFELFFVSCHVEHDLSPLHGVSEFFKLCFDFLSEIQEVLLWKFFEHTIWDLYRIGENLIRLNPPMKSFCFLSHLQFQSIHPEQFFQSHLLDGIDRVQQADLLQIRLLNHLWFWNYWSEWIETGIMVLESLDIWLKLCSWWKSYEVQRVYSYFAESKVFFVFSFSLLDWHAIFSSLQSAVCLSFHQTKYCCKTQRCHWTFLKVVHFSEIQSHLPCFSSLLQDHWFFIWDHQSHHQVSHFSFRGFQPLSSEIHSLVQVLQMIVPFLFVNYWSISAIRKKIKKCWIFVMPLFQMPFQIIWFFYSWNFLFCFKYSIWSVPEILLDPFFWFFWIFLWFTLNYW